MTAMGIQKLYLHHHHYHRNRNRSRSSFSTITALLFLLISLFSTQLGSTLIIRDEGSIAQVTRKKASGGGIQVSNNRVLLLTRRRLVGPGSSPPTCRSKCQRCSPCKPIRVPIQPGLTIIPLEYYPEAWRCMCANKLFMP